MSRVLVTGGAGFIGLRLTQLLLDKGWQVRILDIDTGVYIEVFTNPDILPGAEKVRGSILDANAVAKAIEGCTHVVHCAAMVGVRRTETRRLECLNINIQGTVNILEACAKEQIERLVFISSSELYGEPDRVPITEDAPRRGSSVYALTKMVGEEFVRAYHNRYKFSYGVARLFNIYGEGQVAEFVLPRFVKAVRENRPPTVYGTGQQERCFCHVADAVDGILRILIYRDAPAEVFNIGNDAESITMVELAERVIATSSKTLKAQFVPMEESDRRQGRDIQRRVPSIEKARRLLGYTPQVSLDEGIQRLLQTETIVETYFEPL
ncbi:NAD-dependent epimerase/dehydratase family protein [Nitrospinae bacterium AH_259_B05_G02_I21]|nr:NAD-dependent epimerase/dehydratase family protein [Nitrospinae bacterium AH_259_B05_G02_I21]